MQVSSSSNSSAVMNMLAEHAEGDVEKTAVLLKKVAKAESDMVSKLLPMPDVKGLDIKA